MKLILTTQTFFIKMAAPDNCLQWFMSSVGTFSSFNYQFAATPVVQQLANQDYTICIRMNQVSCYNVMPLFKNLLTFVLNRAFVAYAIKCATSHQLLQLWRNFWSQLKLRQLLLTMPVSLTLLKFHALPINRVRVNCCQMVLLAVQAKFAVLPSAPLLEPLLLFPFTVRAPRIILQPHVNERVLNT